MWLVFNSLHVVRLFSKPRPGDSEVAFAVFESSCHLLLSVYPLKGRIYPVKCLAQ